MMIFILATGYLFAVYLLLALAKRTGKKTAPASVGVSVKAEHQQEMSMRTKVTEAVNSQ